MLAASPLWIGSSHRSERQYPVWDSHYVENSYPVSNKFGGIKVSSRRDHERTWQRVVNRARRRRLGQPGLVSSSQLVGSIVFSKRVTTPSVLEPVPQSTSRQSWNTWRLKVLELAGNAARDNKKTRIIPRHLQAGHPQRRGVEQAAWWCDHRSRWCTPEHSGGPFT
ncbi:hypothetical protein AHF37_04624 [Paragonimus kellicotti]|nr:hypothetical protein AHF37_04624 [Paragonimus kellicotti]